MTALLETKGLTRLLAERAGAARLLAGGTAVVLMMQQKLIRPEVLISLARVDALRGVAIDADGALHLGAMTTLAQTAADGRVRAGWPLLAAACAAVGNVRVRNQAEAALDLIEVEYEPLPSVDGEMDAVAPGAPGLHEGVADNIVTHYKLRRGEVEAAFAASDYVIEETYASPAAQHVTMEPHVSLAQFTQGGLTLHTASQTPYGVRRALAEIFNLRPEQVRVIVGPLGGGYGGKGHIRLEPIVAALAWKAGGRPVKLVATRAEEFVIVTKHAVTIRIKSGVMRDGALTAREVTSWWNTGAYADAGFFLTRGGMLRSIGPYRIPAVRADAYGIYTNRPPAAAFRGAMASQGAWAYESHMDSIAHRLGMDPLELRRKNLLREGDAWATGETMHGVHYHDCLDEAMRLLEADRPQGNIIYGLGPTLFEEMVFDGGQVINANLSDYLIPAFPDIPPVLRTASLEGAGPDEDMCGIGEMTLPCVAPAVANALYDAVGVRMRDLPLTPERILRALHAAASPSPADAGEKRG